MDRWCFLWSHAQALKQTVQFQPMKFLYWGSGESSQFSSQWCKVWISFSFVVNLKTCWTNSLYDSEYIAYFWFTHEMCCCLYCDVQNETTGVILCWLIVDLFENRPCSCQSRHSKRSISCPPPPPPPPPPTTTTTTMWSRFQVVAFPCHQSNPTHSIAPHVLVLITPYDQHWHSGHHLAL